MKVHAILEFAVLFAASSLLQGCAVLLVGAAAGAAGGTVSYYGNELQTVQEVTLDRAWAAAQAVSNEFQFKTDSARSRKDGMKAVLYCRNAQGQPVIITLSRISDKLTDIRIRVGTFDTSANRLAAQQVFEKMRSKM